MINNDFLIAKTVVAASLELVWTLWTEPKHIVNWNNIDPTWHTPVAKVEFVEGGRFFYRMESKSTNEGFDHTGTFEKIVPFHLIQYILDDNRRSMIEFKKIDSGVLITEAFVPEAKTPIDLQQEFCNQILQSFKTYAEYQHQIES